MQEQKLAHRQQPIDSIKPDRNAENIQRVMTDTPSA